MQAVGAGAIAYLILQALGWGIDALLRLLETFARWYRLHGVPWAEEAAIAAAVIYLIVAAVLNSRSD